MPWAVEFHDQFQADFDQLSEAVQDALLAHLRVLVEFGPSLGRPWVGTLVGSRISNLKEMRFDADDGTWRVLFAFNRERVAVLLVAGDKSGVAQARFYRRLIALAERRWRDG